ncbi:MAG: diadenylate cyclase CdaA [Clostridia bacterium]|nr:diadenylate cyclase CdaA [Clostridia bacterium]
MTFSLPEISSLIRNLGFSDVVDIVIMAFVIYAILGYVHNTRAAQLAKGLLFLLAASFIAELCNFYTVSWILGKVLEVGLIALVVIFQPELRRGLEYLGRGKILGKDSMTRMTKERAIANVDVIVRAVEYFSARKEGALIVIERKTAIQDIAETGTIIDSNLTELLIENIFYKGSPLHDGAAIIRGDRILSAGCVLPLTENQSLSKDLGTRHRAGVGMSEVSDALVLIVSEETGIISMAVDGKLSRFLDLKAVEKALLGYYLTKVGKEDNNSLFSFLRRPGNDAQESN